MIAHRKSIGWLSEAEGAALYRIGAQSQNLRLVAFCWKCQLPRTDPNATRPQRDDPNGLRWRGLQMATK
jgi:hypothetical protein